MVTCPFSVTPHNLSWKELALKKISSLSCFVLPRCLSFLDKYPRKSKICSEVLFSCARTVVCHLSCLSFQNSCFSCRASKNVQEWIVQEHWVSKKVRRVNWLKTIRCRTFLVFRHLFFSIAPSVQEWMEASGCSAEWFRTAKNPDVRSHHSLIRLLCTVSFARALRCAHSFACSLTPELVGKWIIRCLKSHNDLCPTVDWSETSKQEIKPIQSHKKKEDLKKKNKMSRHKKETVCRGDNRDCSGKGRRWLLPTSWKRWMVKKRNDEKSSMGEWEIKTWKQKWKLTVRNKALH